MENRRTKETTIHLYICAQATFSNITYFILCVVKLRGITFKLF